MHVGNTRTFFLEEAILNTYSYAHLIKYTRIRTGHIVVSGCVCEREGVCVCVCVICVDDLYLHLTCVAYLQIPIHRDGNVCISIILLVSVSIILLVSTQILIHTCADTYTQILIHTYLPALPYVLVSVYRYLQMPIHRY